MTQIPPSIISFFSHKQWMQKKDKLGTLVSSFCLNFSGQRVHKETHSPILQVRASPPVIPYVILDNKIKCLSLAFIFFGNPTNKTVTGTAYSWGLLIANHMTNRYDQPIRNTEPQSGPIYYTLFWRCTTVLRLLPATASCTDLVQKNQFPQLNRHSLTFSQIQLNLCSLVWDWN